MDAFDEEGYIPPPDYQEDTRKPLLELNLTNSTELWLIRCSDLVPDFDGQELSLDNGPLGSFKDSSGKQYDVVSAASGEANPTVFISSAPESKIVGKISRTVNLVHYPEPNELAQRIPDKHRLKYQKLEETLTSSSSRRFPSTSQGTSLMHSRSRSGRTISTHSSRHKSDLSEIGEPSSKHPKKKRVHFPAVSTQDSGRVHSGVTSTESLGNSLKSKKRRNEE